MGCLFLDELSTKQFSMTSADANVQGKVSVLESSEELTRSSDEVIVGALMKDFTYPSDECYTTL